MCSFFVRGPIRQRHHEESHLLKHMFDIPDATDELALISEKFVGREMRSLLLCATRPRIKSFVSVRPTNSPHFLLRQGPGSLQSQVPRLVCVCELANVRDLQDRAPFVRQSYLDTLPCEVLTSSREQLFVRTRRGNDGHTVVPQICPCDIAPTWRERRMDDLRSSLCSFCSRFGDIPKETTKSIPIVDIPSTLLVHPSNPRSCHDSISGHDENAASSRMLSKIPSNIQLWLHSTCNCSCYRWEVVDRFPNFCNELLLSTSRTSHPSPEETDRICSHRRYPLQDGMGLNDLSHMRFHSKSHSSCRSFHLAHGRLSNTIRGVLSNWAFTQNQLNRW